MSDHKVIVNDMEITPLEELIVMLNNRDPHKNAVKMAVDFFRKYDGFKIGMADRQARRYLARKMIKEGYSREVIAEKLDISVRTVYRICGK